MQSKTKIMKKAFLLLNGKAPQQLPDLEEYDLVVATDGAYRYLQQLGVRPDWISGDFDSLGELPKDVRCISTPNQDYTDFEKALRLLLEANIQVVDVYGASGKEQDHFLGNISIALQYQSQLKIQFYDDYSTYFVMDKVVEANVKIGSLVSIVPLFELKGLYSQGLQYPLDNHDLVFGGMIGTRNRATASQIRIEYTSGRGVVFLGV